MAGTYVPLPQLEGRSSKARARMGATTYTLRQLEVGAINARLRTRRGQETHRHFLANLIRLWPVAVGMAMACFAPQLRDLVAPIQPWGMWIVFPFAALASRFPIQTDAQWAHYLPLVMLYAQFPIEGLLARIFLRNRVTPTGVVRQMFVVHILGLAQLWMASGALWQLATR